MDIISILGLVLGLAVLIMMGFKGWGMIPTSIVGALVVVITNRMDLWEALSTHYGTFMKNYAGDYFLMFFLGTLFGALMGSSGAAKSVACKIVDLMGSKRALLIVVITSAVLSYGGVSFAVVSRPARLVTAVCAPFVHESTRPGFGESAASSRRASAARSPSVVQANSASLRVVSAQMASSPCARLREQTATGPPQTRQRRISGRESFSPAASSTSRS